MSQLHKYIPIGENTGDETTLPQYDHAGPSEEHTDEATQSGQRSRVTLLLSIVFLVVLAALKWSDVVEWVNGEWRLTPQREAERDKQMKNVEDAEQYALIANMPGYYECMHCPSKRAFLNFVTRNI